ncbi:3 beta-hydroxysteroid dehydrogenase type 7-like [Tropilaelaps mercedesae]|uniref:3 beta-hydroxysteroid dehydrogenase type 7-like n=1 Tax=Tropilaelaps mercedesae TaxID=418985 RepID=A0A1V9X629_9ACAR|nr:3 beta-hydroxysteroid dehydrogenase type 7-like [Tropilaelaps mercedesae]
MYRSSGKQFGLRSRLRYILSSGPEGVISGHQRQRQTSKMVPLPSIENTEDIDSLWRGPSVGARTTDTVLVTGSSGCLGQHIVKLLQEHDSTCKNIRLFDVKPYKNLLNHAVQKPMKEIQGDLTNAKEVLDACEGVDCVIHCAALVDISLFPNEAALEAINVEGTRNVIDACIRQNVPYLVFTSTTDTVVSSNHIFYGAENTTFVPKNFLMGPYAETKHRAEQLVLQANNRLLADGSTKLRSCVLRPTVFYGEQDEHFIPRIMKIAKYYGGNKVQRVKSIDERFQVTYVGNAAHAHIVAKNRLRENSDCAGEVYYITDDTPLQELYSAIKPYVDSQGKFRISDWSIPYLLAILGISILVLIVRLVRPIYQVGKYFPTPAAVTYACTSVFFNRQKATLRLKYYPHYTVEESHENSLKYYKDLKV